MAPHTKYEHFEKLPVAEVFYSMQGEGQTMGIPAVFLRLGGCNVLCKGEGWICDTIAVWQKSKAIEFEEILSTEMISKLHLGAHLVITGGEPLLHLPKIENFLMWFKYKYGYLPPIEFETNGTIIMPGDFINVLGHEFEPTPVQFFLNVSPKLTSSGVKHKDRRNIDALTQFGQLSKYHNVEVIFKFVISCKEDVDELNTDFAPFIDKHKIVLMPAGSSQEELLKTRQLTAELAIENNYRYCDRLHIAIWNQKTGV